MNIFHVPLHIASLLFSILWPDNAKVRVLVSTEPCEKVIAGVQRERFQRFLWPATAPAVYPPSEYHDEAGTGDDHLAVIRTVSFHSQLSFTK